MSTFLKSSLILGLLLVSCDKPRQVAKAPDSPAAAPRSTGTKRPASRDLPTSREKLRASFDAAVEIATPEEKNRALAAAVWDALELEPELAREGLRQMTTGSEEKNRLIEHFAMRLGEQNVDEAVQWATALESDEEKSLAFGKIALVLSEKEPERAAHLLSDSGIAGREFDVAVVQVVQRWAQESPADALAWVVMFDPGEARSAGLKEAISIWATDDPQAAFSWVTAIQDEAIRGEAAQKTAEAILDQPESLQAQWLGLATPDIRKRFEKLKSKAEGE